MTSKRQEVKGGQPGAEAADLAKQLGFAQFPYHLRFTEAATQCRLLTRAKIVAKYDSEIREDIRAQLREEVEAELRQEARARDRAAAARREQAAQVAQEKERVQRLEQQARRNMERAAAEEQASAPG